MSGLTIRQYGDPVLKERTRDVEEIDAAVASLVDSMIETMYAAPGSGLAANQVGVQRRIFVYDVGDGARTIINPRIIESDGEWVYDEGCLSVPGLSWEIVRPNAVHLVGLDLDGNEVSIEATELEGRVFQHELDHLDGILLVERLDEDQRKEALKILRSRTLDLPSSDPDGLSKLFSLTRAAASGRKPVLHPTRRAPSRLPYGDAVARMAYLGTPDMAVPPLRALAGAGHDIALCVTRPDRRRGRGGQTTPSPVKEAATELGIPVTHNMDDLAEAGVELAVVVAFGRIIPSRLLEVVPMVNIHFSLLPRWRGAAPVERAILAGDRETGVCLMQVDEGLDTGAVYTVRVVPIDDDVTLADLRTQLVDVASALVVEKLADGLEGLPPPRPQEGAVTIAEKITKEELRLHWAGPAVQLHRVVRLGHAWTTFRGKRLTVLEAAASDETPETGARPPGSLSGPLVVTGAGYLELLRVQPESRSPMSADEWLRGVRPEDWERLGTD